MSFFIIRLCKERKYLDFLVKELHGVVGGDDGLLSYDQLKDLVWLDAIIKEGMRFDIVIAGLRNFTS